MFDKFKEFSEKTQDILQKLKKFCQKHKKIFDKLKFSPTLSWRLLLKNVQKRACFFIQAVRVVFLSWTFPFCRIRQLKQLACPGKNWTIDSEPVIKTAASTGFNVPAHTLPINAVQNRSFNLHFCGPPCRAKDLNGFLGASMCDFPGLVIDTNLSAKNTFKGPRPRGGSY